MARRALIWLCLVVVNKFSPVTSHTHTQSLYHAITIDNPIEAANARPRPDERHERQPTRQSAMHSAAIIVSHHYPTLPARMVS